jgi:hypothetical protein
MEDFKTLPKMQHFKEGGHAKAMCYGGKAMKKGGEVCADDEKQDKKMIKKAFKQHDEAEHDKEPTEIKLKKGGRAKKETGTVKKYKAGGSVENVYGAKKKSGDLDRIEKTKDIKPGKAAAPSKAATKPNFAGSDVAKTNKMSSGSTKAKEVSERPKAAAAPSGAKGGPNKYKTGGKVKKMAEGGMLSDAAISAGSKGVGPKGNLNDLVYRPTDPAEIKELAQKFAIQNPPAPDKGVNYARPMVARKKGGAVKKFADGGGVMDAIGNLGTQLKNNVMGTPEQNRIAQARMDMIARKKAAEQAAMLGGMGGQQALQQGAMAGGMQQQQPAPTAAPTAPMKRGGKVKKMNTGGTCS